MLSVTDTEFKKEIEEYKGLAIVDFWADWCSPCKAFFPIVKEVSDIFTQRVKIMSMNISESPRIPSQYGVRSIPTLMMFKDGKHIERKVGAMAKSALQQWIMVNI